MAQLFYNKRDLSFQLFEVHRAEELTQYAYFQDHTHETFDLTLEAAHQIASTMLKPLLTEMDRKEPQVVDGQARIHPAMGAIIRKFGEDGWINATFDYEDGGQRLPATVAAAAAFIFQAANYSASVFPFLTSGAANLLRSFASKELTSRYAPNMYAGLWQGTMALTEPDAGSSLSDITTSATPTETPGVYQIKGQKIFISAGDHDACDNFVHLTLARIKGAPAGVKGISWLVVPKKRVRADGALESNDVTTAGIYHKMGYKGAPIAHLVFGEKDDCEGYLVGEPHKGLSYMFQMMNEARLGVGMNATAIGAAAYQASLEYAKERPQGRPAGAKDPAQPQVPIIRHADVKRMLLFQKAIVEGSLSLILECCRYADAVHAGPQEEKESAALLLDLLTPVAKSYPSEMCCLTTSAAIQILGGAGYTTDFPVEQFYREARIHPIHEGTTGIHGMDLLGRKVLLHQGKALTLLTGEINKTAVSAGEFAALKTVSGQLLKYWETVLGVTSGLIKKQGANPELFLADATLYLEMFGIAVVGWQWVKQGIAALQGLAAKPSPSDKAFYEGKLLTMQYFFEYEAPKIEYYQVRFQSSQYPTVEMNEGHF